MLYTRRDVGKIALAAIPLAKAVAAIDSKFGGVQIGAITYSFRPVRDVDEVIKSMVAIGLGEAELMSDLAEAYAGAPAPARSARAKFPPAVHRRAGQPPRAIHVPQFQAADPVNSAARPQVR